MITKEQIRNGLNFDMQEDVTNNTWKVSGVLAINTSLELTSRLIELDSITRDDIKEMLVEKLYKQLTERLEGEAMSEGLNA